MSLRITTAIVEPNMLIREGLASLLEKYSYRVIGSARDAVDLIERSLPEAPKLLLVGAETVEHALAAAQKCRKIWPASKIMLLLMGPTNADDFRQLMLSEIDGCAPLSVSNDTFMRAVDLMMLEDGKILVVAGPSYTRIQPSQNGVVPQALRKRHNGEGDGGGKISIVHTTSPALAYINGADAVAETAPRASRRRNIARLSEREMQILDGIVCGHSNKMIARAYGITEATVKVHMKSILRKIQVVNRTQAAVWAMENDYSEGVAKRLLEVDTDGAGA